MSPVRASVFFGFALAVVFAPTGALAQRDAQGVMAQVQQLLDEASAAFDTYAYRKGTGKLEQALALAARHGHENDKKMAEVQVLLGVAAIAGKNDMYRGVHAFVRALRIDPKVELPARLVTPELKRVFVSAGRTIKTLGDPPQLKLGLSHKAQLAAEIKKDARGLDHSPIDEAKRGFPVVIRAATGVELRVKRLYLYYRPAGQVKFFRLEMSRRGNVHRGSIPAQFTKGRYVHYYVEARDPRDNVVATNGSARGPNVVIIK